MRSISYPSGSFFEQQLSLELTLESGGSTVKILSGNIERMSLELHTYGFSSNVLLRSFENEKLDALFTSDNASQIIKATLVFLPSQPQQNSPLLELRGIVTQKLAAKRLDRIGEAQGMVRVYELVFTDHAKATWSEHFPIAVYVEETMKHVLDDQKNPEITVDYQFSSLEKELPIIAFSLPYKKTLPSEQQSSFYSFLNWYLLKENGIWNYDYTKNTYSILSEKPSSDDPYAIFEDWVSPPTYIFPEVPRANKKITGHSCKQQNVTDTTIKTAFEGVCREELALLTPLSALDLLEQEIQSPPVPEQPEVELEVNLFSEDFHIDKLIPGNFLSFRGSSKLDTWTADPVYKNQVFRSRILRLEAHKLSPSQKIAQPVATFTLSVNVLLESKTEPFIERPPFHPPSFPFSIHGTVFGNLGDAQQSTYQILQEGSQSYYQVTVPLAGEEKKLIVPFIPDFMTGQYYFPFCKGEKVILDMYFHTARIQRIVDWQPIARLPQGVQGNQILLSFKDKDAYAILRHEFENLSNSVITLKQASSSTQSQTVMLKEKDMTLQVQDDQKTLLVHLNQDTGLTISLTQSSGMIQKWELNGDAIVHTCKNNSGESKITQKPDSIAIVCNEFKVDAKTISFTAEDKISQEALEITLDALEITMPSPSITMG